MPASLDIFLKKPVFGAQKPHFSKNNVSHVLTGGKTDLTADA